MRLLRKSKTFPIIVACFLIGIVIATFVIPTFVFAVEEKVESEASKLPSARYDPIFFSKNEIVILDPEDVGCSEPEGTTGSELSGNDNRQKIWNFLIGQGLSPEQSAAIVGNIEKDTNGSYSPTYNQSDEIFPKGGYGIANWTEDRRTNIVEYLKAKNPTFEETYYNSKYSSKGSNTRESDGFIPKNSETGEQIPNKDNDALLLTELNYLIDELKGRTLHQPAIDRAYGSDKDTEWDTIKKQKTVEGVSNIWVYSFSIPNDDDDLEDIANTRAQTGQSIYDLYVGDVPVGSGSCSGGGGSKQQIAQQIIDSNNIYYDYGIMAIEKTIIPDIASGKNNGNDWPCGMNINILKGIAAIAQEYRIRLNSLNRACSNDVPPGSSLISWHYAGNGSAVDFGPIDSMSSYSTAGANLIVQFMGPFMVDGSGIGQKYDTSDGGVCLGDSLKLPAVRINYFGDFCNHLHVEVPPDSDPSLQCKAGGKGRCENKV